MSKTAPAPERDEFEEKAQAASAMSIKTDSPPPDEIPPELRAQLIGVEHMEEEKMIFDAVCALSPGNVTVNKIIMAVYQRNNRKVIDRGKALRILNELSSQGRLIKNISPRGFALPNSN